ncbi:MAG: DUF1176 domain-containing protein [Cohaesibacter sp.]|nr:DUF1176 domain-containing protein [Cohaesibacter sp.]
MPQGLSMICAAFASLPCRFSFFKTRFAAPHGLFAILAALLCLQGNDTAQAGGFREFKDSRTWCNTALTCSASTSAKAYLGVTTLSIRRHNPLSSPVEIVLEAREDYTAGDQIDLFIDGKALLHIQVQPDDPSLGSSNYIVDHPGPVDAIIAAMKQGNQALIVLRKNGKQTNSHFSLAGTVASLLFLDEFQDLVGTPYAFHAKGPNKPSARLDVEAITRLDQIPKMMLDRWFRGDEALCSFFSDDRLERLAFGDGFKMRLGTRDTAEGGMLYSLPCGLGGAYNQPYEMFFASNDPNQPVRKIPFQRRGTVMADQDMPVAWNVDWTLKTKSLTSFFKGRGLGDCGSLARWSLVKGDAGYAFHLQDMRVKDECDGNYAGGPDKWPLVKSPE